VQFSFNILSIIIAIFVALACLLIASKFAPRLGLLDYPAARKQHSGSVPLVGGISIFFGIWSGLWVAMGSMYDLWLFLLATFIIFVTGILDDRFNLLVLPRFVLQILAISVMIVGLNVTLVSLGDLLGFGIIYLDWLSIPITIFAIIGVVNAFNLIDGIDGLSGSLSLIALGIMGVLAWNGGRIFESWVALLSSAVLLPYLFFNIGVFGRSRKVFLGDSGSLLLGFIIAWLTVTLSQDVEMKRVFDPVTALWILAIPLTDTVCIMIRRKLKGQSAFFPDRNHIHHILMRLGLNDHQALFLIIFIASILASIGLWMEVIGVPEWVRFLTYIAFLLSYLLTLTHIWKVLNFLRRLITHLKIY